VHASITPERITELVQREMTSLDNPGLCLDCGEEAMGVEPDAREYQCEACDQRAVYGSQELLFGIA
jgi:hypothetical protein